MSPCPSAAFAIAASSAARSRSATTARIERPSAGCASPLMTPCCSRDEQRVGARDLARLVDGRDRHRRVVEEAHEAHFGGALRIGHVLARAVEHQRARGARRAVGRERDLVDTAAPARCVPPRVLRSRSSTSVFTSPGVAGDRGEQRRAVARDDVGELQAAGADLREVVVEPAGERRVEVDDVAVGIDREEAGRRVIEIVDGVLQFLEDVLLPLAVARDVGDRPRGPARVAPALAAAAARASAASAPASPSSAGDAHLLLQLAGLRAPPWRGGRPPPTRPDRR